MSTSQTTTRAKPPAQQTASQGPQPATAPPTLCEAIRRCRTIAADRTRRSELSGAKRNLRALVRSRIVDPLYQQADDETDPIARFNWFTLAGLVEEDTRLTLESMFAELEGTTVNPEHGERRAELATQIEKLKKALKNGGSQNLRW